MAVDRRFDDMWVAAVTRYEEQTKHVLVLDQTFRNLKSLHDLETAIEQGRAGFETFRGDGASLLRWAAKFLKPLEFALDIASSVMGSTPYAPAAVAFVATSYLLKACDSVSKSYDAAEELFQQLGDIVARLQEYDPRDIEGSLKVQITNILAFVLEILGKAEMLIRRRRFKQWVRQVFTRDDEIETCVKRLRQYVETELALVAALTYTRLGDVSQTTKDIRRDVNDLVQVQHTDHQQLRSTVEERRLTEVLRNKAAGEVSKKYQRSLELLTQGTGLWVRDDPRFQAWEGGRIPILWVLGNPGVGKTMLATRTIELLRAQQSRAPDNASPTSVAYMYFQEGQAEMQACSELWRAAAWQLSRADADFKAHCITVMERDEGLTSSRQTWKTLFLDFYAADATSPQHDSRALIVVDGLDEAPRKERTDFLACLADLSVRVPDQHPCRVQVAIFARPDVRGDSTSTDIGTRHTTIIVDQEKNSKDIGAYIKDGLKHVEVLKRFRERGAARQHQALAKHIYSSIQSRAQGMFLWASLVFDQIQSSTSSEAITHALMQAPEGLDNVLHHVFKRFDVGDEMQRSYVRDLLMWVLHARRSFSISELYILLKLSTQQHCETVKHDVERRYASIFTVTTSADEDEEADEQVSPSDVARDVSDDFNFDFLDDDNPPGPHAEFGSISDSLDTAVRTEHDDTDVPHDDRSDVDTMAIPTAWHSTVVTFAHARIRDYLHIEGLAATRRWHDCSIVTQDINDCKIRITSVYVELLSTTVTADYGVSDLYSYAQTAWFEHLSEIDYSTADKQLLGKLALQVVELFHDGFQLLESARGMLDIFAETWFGTDRYSTIVQELIIEHTADLNIPQRDWLQQVQSSCLHLFDPLVRVCSQLWLTEVGWSLKDCWKNLPNKAPEEAVMLCNYYAMLKWPRIGIYQTSRLSHSISADIIEAAASLLPWPKNQYWYTGVAWTIMELGFSVQKYIAVQHFDKALEMAPGAWMPLAGLAIYHGDKLGQRTKGIDLMSEAIQNLSGLDNAGKAEFYLRVISANWQRQLDDPQSAVRVTKAAYDSSFQFSINPDVHELHMIVVSVVIHIEAMFGANDYQAIFDFTKALDLRLTGDRRWSLWTISLQTYWGFQGFTDIFDVYDAVARSAEGAIEFMRESAGRAVSLGSSTKTETSTIGLALRFARWLLQFPNAVTRSQDLCEKVMKRLTNEGVRHLTRRRAAEFRDEAESILGQIYINELMAHPTRTSTFSKLNELAHRRVNGVKTIAASYTALVVGAWLERCGDVERSAWIPYIRPYIMKALRAIKPGDPYLSNKKCVQVGHALLCANDIRNACIAFSITMPNLDDRGQHPGERKAIEGITHAEDPEEVRPTESSGGDEDEADDPSIDQDVDSSPSEDGPDGAEAHDTGFDWLCDGYCGFAGEGDFQELHFCRICYETCFCENCIILLKTDQLPYTACSKDHDHIKMLPLTEDARQMVTCIREGRLEVWDDWLRKLSETWDEAVPKG